MSVTKIPIINKESQINVLPTGYIYYYTKLSTSVLCHHVMITNLYMTITNRLVMSSSGKVKCRKIIYCTYSKSKIIIF